MKKLFSFLTIGVLGLSGCAPGIHGYDVSGKNQICVRECTATYSSCVGLAINTSAQYACESGYRVCSNSCPNR
jgi:hypothetical protein